MPVSTLFTKQDKIVSIKLLLKMRRSKEILFDIKMGQTGGGCLWVYVYLVCVNGVGEISAIFVCDEHLRRV